MTEKDFFERQGTIQRHITIERYKQLNKFIHKGQVVLAGSSLAEQFPVDEMLHNRNIISNLYNRGVSGDTIDDLLADIDTLILDLQPSKLFINIGSNDIGGEVYKEDVLFEKYSELLSVLSGRMPKCKIHVLSYYPVNPDKASFLNAMAKKFLFMNRSNENIHKINHRLENYCQDNGLIYINVHDILLDDSGKLDASLTVEGIHLWPAAYERILDILLPYIV